MWSFLILDIVPQGEYENPTDFKEAKMVRICYKTEPVPTGPHWSPDLWLFTDFTGLEVVLSNKTLLGWG